MSAPERIVAGMSAPVWWRRLTGFLFPCSEAEVYVRADLHDALRTRLASAEAALARAREEGLEEALEQLLPMIPVAAENDARRFIRALRNGEAGGASALRSPTNRSRPETQSIAAHPVSGR